MAKDTLPAVSLPEAKKVEQFKVDLGFLEGLKKDVKTNDSVATKVYWFGTLPMLGTQTIKRLDRETGGVEKVESTAGELFNNPHQDQMWVGRCPWFQNISVRGCTFNAYTSLPVRTGMESPGKIGENRNMKAGLIAEFTKEQVDFILNEVRLTFVRPPVSPTRPETAEIYRVVESDGKYLHQAQVLMHDAMKLSGLPPDPSRFVSSNFDPNKHHPVSDFIYLREIPDAGMWPDLMALFSNPPPSLSGR